MSLTREVRKVRLTAQRLWHFAQTPAHLARLQRLDHPLAADLAVALQQWRRRDWRVDEPSRVEAIEVTRRQWRQDETPLREVDPAFDETETIAAACHASKPRLWCHLLYALVRLRRPAVGLELGANLGVSSAYQAAAMKDAGHGQLTTCDRSAARLKLARQLHEQIGLDNVHYRQGPFDQTLPKLLPELGTIDYAFIDGHHEKQPTLDYFDRIYPHLSDQAIVVFDDIVWSNGMEEAWASLTRDPRFAFTVDLFHVGLGVTRQAPAGPPPAFKVLRPWRSGGA